jgi:hypothetical protein
MEELREKLALTAWFYDGRYLTDVGGRVRESRAPLDEDGLLITDLRAVAMDSKFSVFQERLTQVLDEGHPVIVFTQYLDTPWFTPATSTDHARCRARLHRPGRRRAGCGESPDQLQRQDLRSALAVHPPTLGGQRLAEQHNPIAMWRYETRSGSPEPCV